MRIGLVLPAVPGYSETFFRNKIQFLKATPGYEVVVFVDRLSKGIGFDLCEVVYGFQFSRYKYIAMLQQIGVLIFAFLSTPVKSSRLWRANQKAGFNLKKNITAVLKSFHILNKKLDWLHFGFGTMALRRENLAKVMGVKMAVSFRGYDHYIYPLKNPGCYALVCTLADRVHVLSERMKDTLISQHVTPNKIVVITPAIDHEKFENRKKDEIELHQPIQFITVARLHWIKGLEYTLEAMALLKSRGINFHYTIIGEGEERERLILTVHQLGLKECVTFAGKLSHDEIVLELAQADIYVQYSIQEGFCNAVLEAQAMGLLCIVSDAEGLSENVLHEQTGWVVPKRNPESLADKLSEVIQLEKAITNTIRRRAMHRVQTAFSLKGQKQKFIQFYE